MNLSLLILIPVITAIVILFCNGLKQVRTVSFIGSAIQLLLTLVLLTVFWRERAAGNTAAFLFEFNQPWFSSLHINYHIGVDGIAVSMILLTSFVVLAAVLVSWTMET